MRCFVFIAVFLFVKTCAAQDAVAEKMYLNALANSSAALYVHFDKNIYSNNEMAWFTAYLLRESAAQADLHTVLSVSLISDADSVTVLEEKFVMGHGLAFGNMVIPNLLPSGNYHFMAFTNRVVKGKPDVVFVQPITLRTNSQPKFKANVKIKRKIERSDSAAEIAVNLTNVEGRFLAKPAMVSYKIGNFAGQGQTDVTGQLTFKVPMNLTLKDSLVQVKASYEKDTVPLSIGLPVFTRKASAKFYPEGGYMVNRLPGYISFEVKDNFGRPIQAQAALAKDGKAIDTVQSNYYGVGKFSLVPELGKQYTFKLLDAGIADTTFTLPQTIGNSASISVMNAVVEDTLKLNIKCSNHGLYYLRLHNFRESYLLMSIHLKNIASLKIPMANVPKGLFTITLSDSLNRPVADRMAFAHYDNTEKLRIETDKPVYKPREKVSLTLKLDTAIAESVFSIAVVQKGRISSKNKTDIESYAYLNSDLGALPVNSFHSPYKDKAFVEDLLRTKGWSRYSWLALERVKPSDTLRHYDEMEITGQVNRNNKPLTKATSLGVMLDSTYNLVQTTPTGKFLLSYEQLLAESGRKAYAFLNQANKESYKIDITDPFMTVGSKNVNKYWPTATLTTYNSNNFSLNNMSDGGMRIQEVEITDSKEGATYGALGPNICGDYVCINNILNCSRHQESRENRSPLIGKQYLIRTRDRSGQNRDILAPIIYKGCYALQNKEGNGLFNPLPIIYTAKEFYVIEDPQKEHPGPLATLFWKHAQYLNQKDQKSVEVEFYTGDIKGDFSVVTQGVTNKGFINVEKMIKVN